MSRSKYIIGAIFIFSLFAQKNYSQQPIAIIGAMPEEISIYWNDIQNRKIDTIEGIKFVSGNLKNKYVVLVESGVGKVNSTMTCTVLIQHFKPSVILFTGVAGGLSNDLEIGDIIISDSVVQYDFGTLNDDNSITYWGAKNPIDNKRNPIFFKADPHLVTIAKTAAIHIQLDSIVISKVLRMPKIKTGIIATGDLFIASSKRKYQLNSTLGANAVEMEGGAIAQVCFEQHVPFLIIRSISDLANKNSEVNYEDFVKIASVNSAILSENIIQSLQQKTQEKTRGELYKTELYFGQTYNGKKITAGQWQLFLNNYITPKFPKGLTVVDGYGQWFSSRKNVIIKEPTKILVIIHRDSTPVEDSIERIIQAYCRIFNQESVLWTESKLNFVSSNLKVH